MIGFGVFSTHQFADGVFESPGEFFTLGADSTFHRRWPRRDAVRRIAQASARGRAPAANPTVTQDPGVSGTPLLK